ncbi:RND transporter [Sulfuriferula plumbiphila]|uniref:RND transporter n=1 Tax=Sulfuriferula plumbiphila TaxID=171865 RepID=A0A512LCL0_9PROT|nr:TolC family protein [Sulfuriferula plumbiphila]GEP32219.1 RND transporter [Sulfuriferula plumbiphila]
MKKSSTLSRFMLALAVAWPAGSLAQTVNLAQAEQMSLSADPRVKEREQLVESARALLEQAQAKDGWRVNANLFVGLAPQVNGGFYQGGAPSGTTPRRDGPFPGGLSDWTSLQVALIKPLFTFGKIQHYSEAAQGNIDVRRGDVRISRADTVLDVKRAYYGYLTARDLRRFLEDVQSRLDSAVTRVSHNLKEDNGQSRQSDLYALQAARGMLGKYLSQAKAIEKISLDGLKVLTGVGMDADLQVADASLAPVALPRDSLAELQSRALLDRPEMAQLEAGMRARRALVAAKKSEQYPDVYAGIVGTANYASRRDRLNNPYIYDPFNNAGLTPVVGVKWDMEFGVVPAKVAQEQAELEALNYKNQYAQAGIPFQVSAAYQQVQANYDAQRDLAAGAAAARRWMISALADFSAGLGHADKVAEALKSYALTQAEYLKTVNDYNMDVAQMYRAVGELK